MENILSNRWLGNPFEHIWVAEQTHCYWGEMAKKKWKNLKDGLTIPNGRILLTFLLVWTKFFIFFCLSQKLLINFLNRRNYFSKSETTCPLNQPRYSVVYKFCSKSCLSKSNSLFWGKITCRLSYAWPSIVRIRWR
jgi:hypothetical protein